LAGAGVRRASISGRGLFKDGASDALVRQAFFDGTISNCHVLVPDFGTRTCLIVSGTAWRRTLLLTCRQ
jgi:TP901-1 family phage major tail protein